MSNSYSVTEDIGNGLLEFEKLTSLLTTQHICVNGVALTLCTYVREIRYPCPISDALLAFLTACLAFPQSFQTNAETVY
jgi:hypothetical protein